MKILCPFCDHDLTDVHKVVGRAGAPHKPVTLCVDCGEIVLYEADSFRKPNDDEYEDIYATTSVRSARDVFVKIKNGAEEFTNVTRMWKTYAEDKLLDVLRDPDGLSGGDLYDLLQDVFYSGAAMVTAFAKHHVSDTETREEYFGKLVILEMEINAFTEFRRSKEGPLS